MLRLAWRRRLRFFIFPLQFVFSLAVKQWKGPPGGDGDLAADAAVGWHGDDGYVFFPPFV